MKFRKFGGAVISQIPKNCDFGPKWAFVSEKLLERRSIHYGRRTNEHPDKGDITEPVAFAGSIIRKIVPATDNELPDNEQYELKLCRLPEIEWGIIVVDLKVRFGYTNDEIKY